MKIRIFQISKDRDTHRLKFAGLQEMQKIHQKNGLSASPDPSLYDEVYNGEVSCKTLEDIYTLFNTQPPPFFRGHSLSVSDVVEVIENKNNDLHGAFFCDSIGFESIAFDTSKTKKPDNLLRVVALEPGKLPYVAEVVDDFRAFQQAVGGPFEVSYPFEDDAVIVVNEEGLLLDLEPNCVINGNLYVGPAFIARDGGDGNLYSLTDSQVQKYLTAFQKFEYVDKFVEKMDFDIQMQ